MDPPPATAGDAGDDVGNRPGPGQSGREGAAAIPGVIHHGRELSTKRAVLSTKVMSTFNSEVFRRLSTPRINSFMLDRLTAATGNLHEPLNMNLLMQL